MKYRQTTYERVGGKWQVTTCEVVKPAAETPLEIAVEKSAEENPGIVVVGAAVNDEVMFAGPLEQADGRDPGI